MRKFGFIYKLMALKYRWGIPLCFLLCLVSHGMVTVWKCIIIETSCRSECKKILTAEIQIFFQTPRNHFKNLRSRNLTCSAFHTKVSKYWVITHKIYSAVRPVFHVMYTPCLTSVSVDIGCGFYSGQYLDTSCNIPLFSSISVYSFLLGAFL